VNRRWSRCCSPAWHKEARCAHLLSGEVIEDVPSARAADEAGGLEGEVAALRQEVAELKAQVEKVLRLVE